MSEKVVNEQGEAFGTKVHLAGCGPYYLEEPDMSVGWKMKAFPKYWRGEAAITEINYTVITDVLPDWSPLNQETWTGMMPQLLTG